MTLVPLVSERELLARVGRRIGELRSACGRTQEQLAIELGIATKNLQRIESGSQNLTLSSLGRVARRLGVDARDLLTHPVTERPSRATARRAWQLGLAEAGVELFEEARPGLVPVTTIHEASEALASGEPIASVARAWGALAERRARHEAGTFVARVVGAALEPRIPDGAWCVFRAPASAEGSGELAVVSVRDPDGDGFAVLVRRLERLAGRRGLWRLSTLEAAVEPAIVHSRDFSLVADFVRTVEPARR